MSKPARVPETRSDMKPASLADLQRSREIVATGPSGLAFRLRPLNLERHALSGGLPARLRQVALGGPEAVNAIFEQDDAEGGKPDGADEIRGYLDSLVAEVCVEPDFWQRDSDGAIMRRDGAKAVDLDALDLLLPADYRWLVSIAMGEEDRDGEGRLLWGREPLSFYDRFRHFHGCDADCPECGRMVDSLSADL